MRGPGRRTPLLGVVSIRLIERVKPVRTEFFKTSSTWVVDFRYDGSPRRWFKVHGPGSDVLALVAEELQQLYGKRAQLVEVRRATDEEEAQYLRGDEPKNAMCPTGRRGPDAAADDAHDMTE